jgi:large subunit ribosomal protein L10
MARPEKVAVVEEIREKFDAADAALLTEYRGLGVTELATLRASLRPSGVEYKVFKNTLARRAAAEAGLDGLLGYFEGPTAIAFVKGDAASAAKALREFSRGNPALVIKGGLLGPRVLTPAEVESLADIEPRDVLLARLAGAFQAPLSKAASLFSAINRNFAYGLKAYIEQRPDDGSAAPEPEEAAPVAEAPEADVVAEPEAEAPESAEAEAPAAESTDDAPVAEADAASEGE